MFWERAQPSPLRAYAGGSAKSRNPNDEENPKPECRKSRIGSGSLDSSFGFPSSFVIRSPDLAALKLQYAQRPLNNFGRHIEHRTQPNRALPATHDQQPQIQDSFQKRLAESGARQIKRQHQPAPA